MTITFFSNYLNHHQIAIADELHKSLGDSFAFVTICAKDASQLKGGIDYSDRPYCLNACDDDKTKESAFKLAGETDVAIFAACSQEYAVERARKNPKGLSFEVGERWLKRGWINIFSPTLLKWLRNYYLYYRHASFYKLNCSGFASKDHALLKTYRRRSFKWGYFSDNTNWGFVPRQWSEKKRIVWCSRFIGWKHPELAIELASLLKKQGYQFTLEMIGEGPLLEKTKRLCQELDVTDVVNFLGSIPNEEVLTCMRQSHVCLFTSDRNEGWGFVANEAMENGCVLVASDQIGATPFLIKEGVSGLSFVSGNVDSLNQKVKLLFDSLDLAQQISEHAYMTMKNTWSAQHAVRNLFQLINDLESGAPCSVKEGPCSIDE